MNYGDRVKVISGEYRGYKGKYIDGNRYVKVLLDVVDFVKIFHIEELEFDCTTKYKMLIEETKTIEWNL